MWISSYTNLQNWDPEIYAPGSLLGLDLYDFNDNQLNIIAEKLEIYCSLYPLKNQIRLSCSLETLNKPGFKKIWSIIQKQTLLDSIVLKFNSNIQENDLKQLNPLLEIPTHVPVSIYQNNAIDPLGRVDIRQEFWKNWYRLFIQHMQKSNENWLLDKKTSPEQKKSEVSLDNQVISLKKLIRAKYSATDLLGVLSFQQEVQEEDEINEDINLDISQTAEITITQDLKETTVYSGQLIGYEQFSAMYYEFRGSDSRIEIIDFLQYELFGNLPKAIKYLTPRASEFINENLGTLITFNANNMPSNFKIQKTELGEWVLDIDPNTVPSPKNVFTPRPIEQKHSYFIYRSELSSLIPDEIKEKIELFISGAQYTISYANLKLYNLWYRYGNIDRFLETLNECFSKHDEVFKRVFCNCYLNKFVDFSDFYEDPHFYQCMQQLSTYDEAKATCFSQFLAQTDSNTQYDLSHLVNAFEVFWSQWSELAQKNNLPASIINEAKWSHPPFGSPVVYMERLITILKNARNLPEQLDNLCYTPEDKEFLDQFRPNTEEYNSQAQKKIKEGLRNYGDYYASDVEHFKLVSPLMELEYKPEEANTKPFNKDAPVYVTTLSNLKPAWESIRDYSVFEVPENTSQSQIYANLFVINSDLEELNKSDCVDPLYLASYYTVSPPSNIYYLDKERNKYLKLTDPFPSRKEQKIKGYRFIGQQTDGISLSELNRSISSSDYFYDEDIILILLFMGHDKYQNLILPKEFASQSTPEGNEVLFKRPIKGLFTQKFIELYESGIRFNELDGIILIKQLNRIHYYLFHKGENKQEDHSNQFQKTIEEFFQLLKENPHAMLKCLKALPTGPHYPFLNDVLTTSNRLTLDCEELGSLHKDNLLLFSSLINLNSDHTSKVQQFLLKIAHAPFPSPIDIAFRYLLQMRDCFSSDTFLKVFEEIEQLPTNSLQNIINIFENHHLKQRGPLTKEQNTTYASIVFKALKNGGAPEILLTMCQSTGANLILIESQLTGMIPNLINQLKSEIILHFFGELKEKQVKKWLGSALLKMEWFSGASNLEAMNKAFEQLTEIEKLFTSLLNLESFHSNRSDLLNLLNQADLVNYSFEELKLFLVTLTCNNTHQRFDFKSFLPEFILFLSKSTDKHSSVLEQTKKLIEIGFPLNWVVSTLKWTKALNAQGQHKLIEQLKGLFKENPNDPLLEWLITEQELTAEQFNKIIQQTQRFKEHRDSLVSLFQHIPSKSLDNFLTLTDEKPLLYNILVLAQSKTISKNKIKDYSEIIELLKNYTEDELTALYNLIEKSSINITSLRFNLKEHENNFSVLLSHLEKSPFGRRSLKQFDTSQVERVVNNFINLNLNSRYTYAYRKQMTEAFLFINKTGETLPIYNNKPAKDLSNIEIQALFKQLSNKEPTHLDPFQRRLYALGLIREAIYRNTGKFAYSTQMLAIIDCMMHDGDTLTNINTGEGKSLVDVMKSTLLWLEGGGVDITTASLDDAERDLKLYKPFFSFLGIPCASKVITSKTEGNEYALNGINFSTLKQLALFYTKVKAENKGNLYKALFDPNRKISLVMNEADTDFHDDKVVIRYAASTENELLSEETEWVYGALNDFVNLPEFNRPTSKTQDIRFLRQYLKNIASSKGANIDFLNKIPNEQLLKWIESAIVVNFVLEPNIHYVIPDGFKTKKIYGKQQVTRTIEVLMPDGKTAPGVQYGNGMQQLLYDKLNKERGKKEFILEPETRVIYSLNIKNMLRYYLSRIGFLWGGSGSLGSSHEIERQFKQHGIVSSKIDPHLPKITQIKKFLILENEKAQFNAIIQTLQLGKSTTPYRSPTLVFFKDIPTAKRFYDYLQEKTKNKNQPIQYYAADKVKEGAYDKAVENAAQSGMITVTTSAFSRNTDISYQYDVGMNVIETCAGLTERDRIQRYGRTGRQGSKGTIYPIFNKQELGNKTREEIQQEIEKASDYQRAYYEELYDILYEFEQLLPDLEPNFYKEKWAYFDIKAQKLYDEANKNNYNREQFLAELIPHFNEIMGPYQITATLEHILSVLNQTRTSLENKGVLDKPIKLSECTPPEIIAYYFLNQNNPNAELIDLGLAKEKLQKMLNAFSQPSFSELNNDYIYYLNSSRSDKNKLRALHQEVISQFLFDKTLASQKTSMLSKWFGQGVLNKLIDNDAYLSLCAALLSKNETSADEELSYLKDALKQLFQEYLDYSWFISSNRREETKRLIQTLDQCSTIEDLIEELSKSKINRADQDCAINEQNLLRQIKPLHLSGTSRLHATYDRALNLTAAMSNGKITLTQLTKDLAAKIDSNLPSLQQVDDISQLQSSRDAYTGKVIKNSMFSFFKNHKDPSNVGMKGRNNKQSTSTLEDENPPKSENNNPL